MAPSPDHWEDWKHPSVISRGRITNDAIYDDIAFSIIVVIRDANDKLINRSNNLLNPKLIDRFDRPSV